MIIDTHQHFWKYDPERDSWIDDSMSILKSDFLPSDLHKEFTLNGVDGCIAVQADQSETETTFLLELAEKHDFIKGVVGWVNLMEKDVEQRLEHFSRFEKLKGFRHIVQTESDDFMLREDFLKGISKLAAFNFVYDILIFHRQLPYALQLVERFPNQVFVIDHLAKPNIKEGELQPWAEHIQHISRYNNVFCKVSGFVTEASWQHWSPDEFNPYFDVVFNAFGPDRLLFGSDWPVCLLAAEYSAVLEILVRYMEQFSQTDKDKILALNAIKVYDLND